MSEAPSFIERMAVVSIIKAALPEGTGAVVIFVTKTTDNGQDAALISSMASVPESVAREAVAAVLARYQQGEAYNIGGSVQ